MVKSTLLANNLEQRSVVQCFTTESKNHNKTHGASAPLTKETDETLNRNPLRLFDCLGHWRWHGCTLGRMVVVMTKDEIFELIEANGLTLHGDIEHFAALVADSVYAQYLEQPTPSQTGVISITVPEPVAYLCENAAGHRYFRWKKPSGIYKPIALYTKEQA